jgi:hypothetical protein
MTKEALEERIRKHIKDADQMDYNGMDELVPVFNREELVENLLVEFDEWAKQQSIAFRRWMDEKGYFCQMNKDHQLGYIRQENQILFSSWKSPEDTYNLFLEDQKKQQ